MRVVDIRLVVPDALERGDDIIELTDDVVTEKVYEAVEFIMGAAPLATAGAGNLVIADLSVHQVSGGTADWPNINDEQILEALRTGEVK